jgi:hypothetical protein
MFMTSHIGLTGSAVHITFIEYNKEIFNKNKFQPKTADSSKYRAAPLIFQKV